MTPERKTEVENIRRTAINIASELIRSEQGTWVESTPGGNDMVWAKITGPGGAVLHLQYGSHRYDEIPQRLVVSPIWPLGLDGEYGAYKPREDAASEITVSLNKNAKQIAADITRRLLKAYLPQLAYAQAQKGVDQNARKAQEETAARLATIVPGSRVSDGKRRDLRGQFWNYGETHYTAQVNYNGTSVNLKVDVSVATAEKILRVLADVRKAEVEKSTALVNTTNHPAYKKVDSVLWALNAACKDDEIINHNKNIGRAIRSTQDALEHLKGQGHGR